MPDHDLDAWENETHHLRQWVCSKGAPTSAIRRELAMWLVRLSDSPAHAVDALAVALHQEGDR